MSGETNEKPTITHTEIEALEDETLEDMTEVEDGGAFMRSAAPECQS